MENCNEVFLNEVTHVELVVDGSCAFPVPFNVGELAGMENCTVGSAAMSFDVTGAGATAMMDTPVLKTQEKAESAGRIRTHDLQIPVKYGYDEVRSAKGGLAGRYFHAFLRTAAGTEFLIYGLPNTSAVTVEDQMGGEPKQTVKVSLQSMSNMIRLT